MKLPNAYQTNPEELREDEAEVVRDLKVAFERILEMPAESDGSAPAAAGSRQEPSKMGGA